MKILVTGNLGYIGSVLTQELTAVGHDVSGLDVGYFRDCTLAESPAPARQIIRDIREVGSADLENVEGVIHLAGLSNDPLGEFDPRVTDATNREATARLAALAKSCGVRRFVYASSQSMYGVSGTDQELDEDTSEKNPITAYARTKWEAEVRIKEFADADFTVVCMRPSTVFGASPRLRCDIVFNNLVACAFTTGRIEIKSDGTPWRPVVHVRDVCSAFRAGLEAPAGIVNARSYNVGIPNGNFTVRQLAEAAQRSVPGSTLTFTGEHGGDSRTYRVGFTRILTELAGWYRPEWDLDRGGAELVEFFDRVGFTEADFRGEKCVRLARLKRLTETGAVDGDMRFIRG
jgi:nucleoside-diphosphate-sugar epimerase